MVASTFALFVAYWEAGEEQQEGCVSSQVTVALRASAVSVSSLQEVASLHPEFSEQPEPSANIPALSCTEVCKQEGPSAQMNQMPAVHCFPHSFPLPGARDPCVYPRCTYTVKKLWASVSTSKAALAAALEMEPDNFGYEWLVCSWGWNYCWWRSCTDGLAGWCHLHRQGETWAVAGPPLSGPVPGVPGSSTEVLWKGASCCQVGWRFVCCVGYSLKRGKNVGCGSIRRKRKKCVHCVIIAFHSKASRLLVPFEGGHLEWLAGMCGCIFGYGEAALEETHNLGFGLGAVCSGLSNSAAT